MKTAFAAMVSLLAGCGSDPQIAACFPCEGYWICGGDVTRVDLAPAIDGCYLSGLPGRNLLLPDETITADGAVVGKATGTELLDCPHCGPLNIGLTEGAG